MLQELVDKLRAELPGYHFELTIFPMGGTLDADACEECGTTVSASSSWRQRDGVPRQTLDDAVAHLKEQLLPSP